MQLLNCPLTIFTSQKRFNDRSADDMKCGDLDEYTLKNRYHLGQISNYIDWASYKPSYDHPATRQTPAVSKEKAVSILFDELRGTSWVYSFRGPYKGLIVDMFNHMQNKNGVDFSDIRLNQAYKELIESERSESSVLAGMKFVLD